MIKFYMHISYKTKLAKIHLSACNFTKYLLSRQSKLVYCDQTKVNDNNNRNNDTIYNNSYVQMRPVSSSAMKHEASQRTNQISRHLERKSYSFRDTNQFQSSPPEMSITKVDVETCVKLFTCSKKFIKFSCSTFPCNE